MQIRLRKTDIFYCHVVKVVLRRNTTPPVFLAAVLLRKEHNSLSLRHKLKMKRKVFLSVLLALVSLISAAELRIVSGFDRSAFYNALASDNIEEINNQLNAIKTSSLGEKEAFEGALLMKKAGLVTKAKDKLSLFKEGRKKLEASIRKDNENAEYCFLRLIIQEHAPKAVDYRNNIDHDSKLVKSNYKNLPSAVQQAIIDYSKKSKALKGLLP